MIVILHLSDIHINKQENPILTRVDTIAAALRAEATQVETCFIVVSGDIAFSGRTGEYSIARRFLSSLLRKIESDHSMAQVELILVPGNHDCNFQNSSGLRDLVIGNFPNLEDFDVNSDIVINCLSVQDKFFEFFKALTGCSLSSTERLYGEREYQVGDYQIRFYLYNTAWVSQLNEEPGKLFYPVSLAASADSLTRPVDMAVSVLHHSLNWLEPTNARNLRSHLERTSDIILTGHEHVSSRVSRSSDSGSEVTHVEGAALQVRDHKDSSGFNIIYLDLNEKRQRATEYKWAHTLYKEVRRPKWVNFNRNPLLAQLAFVNNSRWSEVLEDPGTAFTHPRRDSLKLSDLFVYPDLSWKAIEPVVSKRDRRVASDKLVEFITSNSNIILTGPSNSGKTTLAKRLYVDIKQYKGVVPILLTGTELKQAARKRNFLKAFVDAFSRQYSVEQSSRYTQLEPSKRLLIIDDFEQSRLSRKAQKDFLSIAKSFAGYVLIFADDLFMIEQMTQSAGDRNKELDAFEHCEIKEFGFQLRGTLIERWLGLGYEMTEPPENFEHQIATTEKMVVTLLGKNLLPSFPLTILTILQTAEASASPGTASGSYGYLYEALITSALARVNKSLVNVDMKYTYLAHLAYAFYKSDTTSGLSREAIDEISMSYFSKFRISFSVDKMLSELEQTDILTVIGGNYAFKYKYIYCYFIARYFRDSVSTSSDARAEIRRISSRLHVEDNANVLVFYLYLTRDVDVIEHVLKMARQVYADYDPCDFEKDVRFVNNLYVDNEPLILPAGDPAEHRENERARRDELIEEDEYNEDIRDLAYRDDLDDVLKVNFSLKTLHVMGQVLRNFPGSLQSNVKANLATESYLLGLRTLNAILRIAESNLNDLRIYVAKFIQEHRSINTTSELKKSTDEAVIWMTLTCAFGMTKRISSAVGLYELSGTFDDVLVRLGKTLPVRIIDTSVKLDHFPNVPFNEISSIADDTKQNHFTRRVLRDLVVNHMYLFNIDYRFRQKLGEMLDIQGTHPQFISNPSKKIQ